MMATSHILLSTRVAPEEPPDDGVINIVTRTVTTTSPFNPAWGFGDAALSDFSEDVFIIEGAGSQTNLSNEWVLDGEGFPDAEYKYTFTGVLSTWPGFPGLGSEEDTWHSIQDMDIADVNFFSRQSNGTTVINLTIRDISNPSDESTAVITLTRNP
jgi:hypothetical protein